MSTIEKCGHCRHCADRDKYPDNKNIMEVVYRKNAKLCDSIIDHPFVKIPFVVYDDMPARGSFKIKENTDGKNGF